MHAEDYIIPARAWIEPPMVKILLRRMLLKHHPKTEASNVKTNRQRPAEKKTRVACQAVGKWSGLVAPSIRLMNEAQCRAPKPCTPCTRVQRL